MAFKGFVAELVHFKDHRDEARLFASRIFVAMVIALLLFGLLVARFYYLQVIEHTGYVALSDANRIQVQPVPPTRGLIYDRNGILLADNRPSFTLSLVRERIHEMPATLETLRELAAITDEEIADFHKAMAQRRRPFQAVPLKYSLTEEEIARISVNEYRLQGVEVDARLVRHYPYGNLFAHTVGYTGRINERELQSFDPEEYQRYSGVHSIGKVGLEKSYEDVLAGRSGDEYVEANARGRVLRVLERTAPQTGEDLHLFIDMRLQQTAYAALDGRRGSVVAVDVATGGVLAMASAPSYDPNLFVTGIGFDAYRELRESPDMPLFNRSIQGQYPPASTLKPVVGLAGLHSSYVTAQTRVRDPGFYTLPNDSRQYREWKRGGHNGPVDLHQAIVESCDIFFYDLAYRMGIDRMHGFGAQFGLGARTGIDMPAERLGNWPSRDWKRGYHNLPWFPGDSLNASIGQGFVLVTPLQLAVVAATLASRGEQKKPRLVEYVGATATVPKVVNTIDVDAEHWDYIVDAMTDVVHGARGTASGISSGLNYQFAGKTGTAQVVGRPQGEEYDREALAERNRPHALFIGFAPAENPRIAVAVIVENGEFGSSTAAPIARSVVDAYMALEDGGVIAASDSTSLGPVHTNSIIAAGDHFFAQQAERRPGRGSAV
jgi:penicillin-binding protein 2